MAKVKAENSPAFTDFEVPVGWIIELNFFDMTGEKARTNGTSNKMYRIELQVSKDGRCQLFTQYGPTGKVQANEYRFFGNDRVAAEKEFNSIKKSKLRKGYVEIDVAQRANGSDEAKKITKSIQLNNAPVKTSSNDSKLHPETSRVISKLMGATNDFVIQTLKCPLGQLTNAQIDSGRECLNQAKTIVAAQNLSESDKKEIVRLTNQFYGLIPHNLGAGSRGQMTHLLLDSKEKINQKEYDLDTLLDAKAIGATLVSDSVYDKYLSLDTIFEYIPTGDSLFKWLDAMIQETRASNHRHLGNIKLINAWDIQRNNERDLFLNRTRIIAKECGVQVIPPQMSRLVKSRKDVYDSDLFEKANVIPLFHGTRTQNITGILKKGMLIRPSGVIITGSMYGSGAIYKSAHSTKSINYTNIKASYWAHGSDDRAFLFVSDCALGKQLIAKGPYSYTIDNIKPNHSVWAKGGQSGVINDEMMLYRTDQHNLRYLLEFTCQVN